MSVEEDIDAPETELKELVTQALEENGLLSKIRAQLRAGLYVALENEINETNKHCHINNSLKSNLAKAEIRTVFCLVREFLEYFELDFTNTVFEKESFMGILYDYRGKERLIKELEIGIEHVSHTPLLVHLLNIARNSYKYSTKIMDNESMQNASSFINESKEINNATYEVCPTQNSRQFDALDSPKHISVPSSHQTEINVKCSINDSNDTSISSVESHKEIKSFSNEDLTKTPNISNIQKPLSLKNEEVVTKIETDDTYEGTSSLAEDSVATNKDTQLIDFDKTTKISTNSPVTSVKSLIDQTIDDSSSIRSAHIRSDISEKKKQDKTIGKCLIDQTIDDSPLNKTPRLLSESSEKKKHDKIEKPKPMSALSSLADLPPIQITKNRSPDTVLLPSLYSKEFRDRSNLKEIDKLLDFDSIDNYEEDDILSTGIDYERNKNVNSILSRTDSPKPFLPVKLFESENKNLNTKKIGMYSNSEKESSEVNSNSNTENKKDADNTSISEDFNSTSNSDQVSKSDKT